MSTPSTTRMTTEPERTLADIATRDGVFSIIAMDQRNTLRRMFSAVGIVATDDDLITAKTDVARALTPLASGILFDPTYGVPAVTGTGALASGVRARATSVFAVIRSSSVATIPTALNMRRNVFR